MTEIASHTEIVDYTSEYGRPRLLKNVWNVDADGGAVRLSRYRLTSCVPLAAVARITAVMCLSRNNGIAANGWRIRPSLNYPHTAFQCLIPEPDSHTSSLIFALLD